MKKILSILVLSLMLVGCGGEETSQQNQEEVKGFAFEVNGTEIYMNEDTSLFLDSLGDEIEYFEAKSCAFDGLDKTYTYSGFQLKTYPKDDHDYVNSIILTDDTVATQEGISIGNEKSQVVEKYGKDYQDNGNAYIYTKEDSQLQFLFEDDYVSAITYTAITD